MMAYLGWLIAIALQLWSAVGLSNPELRIQYRIETVDWAIAYAYPDRQKTCHIVFGEYAVSSPEEYLLSLVAHEVGHCLGLWEHSRQGVMSNRRGKLLPTSRDVLTPRVMIAVWN